jgi:hypothetical protein
MMPAIHNAVINGPQTGRIGGRPIVTDWRGRSRLEAGMKARITIEYDLPEGDQSKLREREERRWMTCETLRQLRSVTAKVELIEEPSPAEPPSIS